MYTNQTGALPVRSLDGMQYFFIAYDYDTNYIFAKPINNLKDESIIAAFEFVEDGLECCDDGLVLEVVDGLGKDVIGVIVVCDETILNTVERSDW